MIHNVETQNPSDWPQVHPSLLAGDSQIESRELARVQLSQTLIRAVEVI